MTQKVFSLIPDHGKNVGSGHLSRISALAMALLDEGAVVNILAPKSKIKDLMPPAYFKKIKFSKAEPNDFVLVDSYNEKRVPKNAKQFAVFVDHEISWQKKAILKLKGVCLRVPYFKNSKIKPEKRVLILLKPFLNKSESKKFLNNFVKIALEFVDKIDVVESSIEFKDKNVKMHKFLKSKELFELIQKSNFAFAYAGQSSLEISAIGCPLLTYQHFENQKENIKILKKSSNVIIEKRDKTNLIRLDNLQENIVKLRKLKRIKNKEILNGASEIAKLLINYK